MRQFGKLEPTFWTRGSGRRLRGHVEAQLVACYLFSAPGSNMIGIFHLPIYQLIGETGLPEEGARKGLRRVCDESIAIYDERSELVFVLGLVTRGVGETLKAKDKRVKALEKELDQVGKHWFAKRFLELYRASLHLRPRPELEGLESPCEDPSEGPPQPPSKPEKEKETKKEIEKQARAGAPENSAAAGTDPPELVAIRKALEHPSFANIADLEGVALDRYAWFQTLDTQDLVTIETYLGAIREAAGDCTGTGMQPHEKVKKIRTYTHRPRKPRDSASIAKAEPGDLNVEALRSRPGGASIRPKEDPLPSDEPPMTPAEIEAAKKRDAERTARLAAQGAKSREIREQMERDLRAGPKGAA